jgi:hypothetical protein
VNYELEWTWKDGVMAEFKTLSRNLPRRSEENDEKPVSKVAVPARIRTKYIYMQIRTLTT